MGGFSTFAAGALADLGVAGVGNSGEGLYLSDFSFLLESLGDSVTEAWELTEFAWAFG